MPLLTANALYVSKRKRNIIDGLSFVIHPGEIIGLLGPNGSGKTTTFKTIMGFERLDQGSLSFNDVNITRSTIDERVAQKMTYLPQESSVFQELSVSDNLRAILELQKNLNTAAIEDQTQHLLETFRLVHLKNQKGSNLSGGERRRTEIARAMATKPKLLLLDEPFAGIDPIAINGLKSIIGEVSAQGVAVLITDHNVRETLSLCGRAYMLYQGRCIAEGSEAELIKNKQVKETYLGTLYD
jgi:lipopolysaccharide export system ATP-binding protein